MTLPKCLDFNDYNKYPSDDNPTTDAEMQSYLGNQNTLLNALCKYVWQPNTEYVVGQIVVSNSLGAGIIAVVIIAGTSGTTEPNWPVAGSTVTSGNVTFKAFRLPIGLEVSGSGNAITNASVIDGILSMSKGATFIQGSASGSATKPVYINSNGQAAACTYSLNKDVPSNAVFTDTKATVTTSGSGNAITALTASNGALTATKGSTFSLSNHTHSNYLTTLGTVSKNTKGYMQFSNGLVINWNYIAPGSGGSGLTWTFAKAFTTVYCVLVARVWDSSSGSADAALVRSFNNSSAVINTSESKAGYSGIAIGVV